MVEQGDKKISVKPHESRWRTLIEVLRIDGQDSNQMIRSRIPGWDPKRQVSFPLSKLSSELQNQLQPGYFLIAEANMAASKAQQLKPSNFETVLIPTTEDDFQ